MSTTLAILLCAFVVSILTTPIARRLALRTGTVDAPAARKIHHAPIPLLGGLAIYAGCVLALVLFGERAFVREFIAILAAATLVSACGLVDDRWTLHAYPKLLGQLAAALILVYAGITIQLFTLPWLNTVLTVVWIVGITNALNLLDNMDGLSSGVATVCAVFFLLLAAQSGQILVSALAAGLIGACLGFLRYNFNPASIFMGDTGSLFIGLLLAVIGIKLRFPSHATAITWMIPVAVLAFPVLDTTLVTVTRLRRGVNPLTTPGKDHVSHRLVDQGMSRREAVLTCYLMAGVGGVFASYIASAVGVDAYVAGGLLALLWVGTMWRLRERL